MKLLQANIWGGRLGRAISDLAIKENIDIANFQEVISIDSDFGALFSRLQDFVSESELSEAFYSPVMSFNIMSKEAEWGNAIVAKLPIKSQHTIFTNLEYRKNFTFNEGDYNIRNLQHATFELNGKKLHVLNHHGHHFWQHKNGDSETLRQSKMIADYVSELEGPVILTGDFNLAPSSDSIKQINKVLRNLSTEYKLSTTRTLLTHKTEVCDYIFVSDDIKVNDFYASDSVISDHKALILDFDI